MNPLRLIVLFIIVSTGLLIAGAIFLLRERPPTADEALRWKNDIHARVVLKEAQEFRALTRDLDTPRVVFSYKIPENVPMESVFGRIVAAAEGYRPVELTSSTLVLVSSDGRNGYDVPFSKYHLVLSSRTRRVAVLNIPEGMNVNRVYDRNVEHLEALVEE